MGKGVRFAILGISGAGAVLAAALASAQDTVSATVARAPGLASGGPVVAIFGDRPITASEVESRVKARLFKARQDEYDARVDGIRALAFELAQDQQAAKVGLSREAYYKREVTDKVADPSEDEVQKLFTTYRARLPKDDEAARTEVRRALRNRNTQQRAEQFKSDLLAGVKLRITLDPPRLDVPIEANDPAVGPPAAPVTLVEFSDFQCPFCLRGQSVIKQLRADYGDRVHFVFKQLPLGMHPQARLAAEAALCAADQGKYWEAREWLFNSQGGVTPDSVKGWAGGAGIDAAAFAKCVDEHAHAKDVEADMATADSVATSSTPTFFVNGRLLQGALPIADFRSVIDDELARATPRDPVAAKP